MIRSRLVIACSLTLAMAGAAHAGANLVVNGDFSAGDTGFATGYVPTTVFAGDAHGVYDVEPASNIAASAAAYGDWTNIGADPSGGDGNVFVADGSTSAATAWSETVTVKPNMVYTFSYDGAEVSNACCSNATLVSSVNGVTGPTLAATASWQNSTFSFNSGTATSATLSVIDTNTSGPYNDFALDDFSLTSAVPEPRAWSLLLVGFGGLGAGARLSRRRQTVAA